MEHHESKLSPLREIEELRSKFFQKGMAYYMTLMKGRLSCFEKEGELEITSNDGAQCKQPGNVFIEELIRYFESKDSAPYYRMCADLKKLLNEYLRKFPARRYKSRDLTPLEKARLNLFHAHVHSYHMLKRYGPNLFEEDGSIITKGENGEHRRDGRDYILRVIKYFADKDQAIYYRMCAKLKIVLDDYEKKFTKKGTDIF